MYFPAAVKRSHVRIVIRQLETEGILLRKQCAIAVNRRIEPGHAGLVGLFGLRYGPMLA